MVKKPKSPLLKPAAESPVDASVPSSPDGAEVLSANEITQVMAGGFNEADAKKIVEARSAEKPPAQEAQEAKPEPKAKLKPMLAVQAVNPQGFHRIGHHFQHGKPTLLDPAKLTDEQWARLDEAVNLHVLVVREVEA